MNTYMEGRGVNTCTEVRASLVREMNQRSYMISG